MPPTGPESSGPPAGLDRIGRVGQNGVMAVVRPTEPADLPGVHRLIGAIYQEYDQVLNVEADEPHLVNPGQYFRKDGGEFWVVEVDGTIRATVAVRLHPDQAELKSLYVHPSLRRQGWGEKLTRMAIDWARRAGKPRMILWSDVTFTRAHRLYERLGFTRFGERQLHDTNNAREYGYALPLAPQEPAEDRRT